MHKDLDKSLDWPNKGQVEFHNYCTRYRAGLDLVIKNLSIQISPNEKVILPIITK